MKKVLGIGIICVALVIIGLMVGCGSSGTTAAATTTTTAASATTTTTTTSTTSTTAVTGSIATISGSIYSGSVGSTPQVSASGVKSQAIAYAAVPSYTVVAVGKDTGTVTFADTPTDSNGNFSINPPTGEGFYLEILDANLNLVAPVAFGTSNGMPVMAIEATGTAAATVDLGQIVFDSTKGAAATTDEVTAYLTLDATVEAKSGETFVPKGADNFGKGTVAETSATNNLLIADIDGDGLPNIFDADNDGDGIVDEFDLTGTKEVLTAANSKIEKSYAFTNLKVPHMHHKPGQNDHYQNSYHIYFFLTLGIVPKSGHTISSARLISGPAWVDRAVISAGTSQSAQWRTETPAYSMDIANGSAFKSLSQVIPSGEAAITAGQALRFHVEFSDGTSEEVVKMINFVFTDIPLATQFSFDGTTWTSPEVGKAGSLGNATSKEVHLRWNRPIDENGNDIIGAQYTWEYSPNLQGLMSELEIIPAGDDDGTAPYLSGSYNFSSLISDEATSIGINICIRTDNNDNASHNLQFDTNW